jgi:hypothetical protein
MRNCLLLCLPLLFQPIAAADAPRRPAPTPMTAAPKPPAAPPTKPAAPHDALLSAVDEITTQVVAIRGLPLKSPFKRGVLSREEIGRRLKERISKEYTPEEVQIESGVLKRMGLLPIGADYEKLLFDLLTEQVAGFYDPYTQTLYVADWLPLEMQRPALAHEIEHALQDQHFDLKRFSQPLKEDGDRQLARASLIEGDGTALMLEFVARSMGLDLGQMPEMISRLGKQMMQMTMGATPAFQQAPPVLRETLVFPYAAGLDYVESMRIGHPWSRIDEVFRRPPESTEQVLHPDKYHGREAPVPITPAPIAALGGRKELKRDVLGEMAFKIWFASKLPEEAAERAAAGWGGDRLVAYAGAADGSPEATLPILVSLSVWDSERDAREAERAAKQLTAALAGPPSKDTPERAQTSATAERRGRSVLILLGVPPASQAAVVEEVLRGWKVGTAKATKGPG